MLMSTLRWIPVLNFLPAWLLRFSDAPSIKCISLYIGQFLLRERSSAAENTLKLISILESLIIVHFFLISNEHNQFHATNNNAHND